MMPCRAINPADACRWSAPYLSSYVQFTTSSGACAAGDTTPWSAGQPAGRPQQPVDDTARHRGAATDGFRAHGSSLACGHGPRTDSPDPAVKGRSLSQGQGQHPGTDQGRAAGRPAPRRQPQLEDYAHGAGTVCPVRLP